MGCNVVTKYSYLHCGSCDHIELQYHLECSYHVIMFVGPLGDSLSFGDLCSVYKVGYCRSSGPGKK